MGLAAYSAERDIPHPTANQWDLIHKIVAVLNPVEEIPLSISTELASVSLVIPFIRAFGELWRIMTMTME